MEEILLEAIYDKMTGLRKTSLELQLPESI